MGTDYFHGVYAAATSSRGGLQTALAIEDVLRTHGLVDGPVSRWSLDAENVRLISRNETALDVRNVGSATRRCLGGTHSLSSACLATPSWIRVTTGLGRSCLSFRDRTIDLSLKASRALAFASQNHRSSGEKRCLHSRRSGRQRSSCGLVATLRGHGTDRKLS